MDPMRSAALNGEIILWIVEQKTYAKLRKAFKSCKGLPDFSEQSDNVDQIKIIARDMGVKDEHIFEDQNTTMEALEDR